MKLYYYLMKLYFMLKYERSGAHEEAFTDYRYAEKTYV